ncbi:MAG: DoxX family protein, partial [Roseiarcus sp.]
MSLAFEKQVAKLDDAVLLASRLLLAWLFVHEGLTLVSNFGPAAEGMSKMGVPPSLLIVTIALQLLGGVAIAIGWHARLGAVGLGLFCLATAVLFHQNFAVRNELLHFEKDLAIAGGMFVLMVRGPGAWSLRTSTTAVRWKKGEGLPMQPGQSDDGAETATTREVERDNLVLSGAVEMTV